MVRGLKYSAMGEKLFISGADLNSAPGTHTTNLTEWLPFCGPAGVSRGKLVVGLRGSRVGRAGDTIIALGQGLLPSPVVSRHCCGLA